MFLEKKFIEEAREIMDRKIIAGDYRWCSKYLELNKIRLPRVIYAKYREMLDLKLYDHGNTKDKRTQS